MACPVDAPEPVAVALMVRRIAACPVEAPAPEAEIEWVTLPVVMAMFAAPVDAPVEVPVPVAVT